MATSTINPITRERIISLLDAGHTIERVVADFDLAEADVIAIARRAKITKAFNLTDIPDLDGYHASTDGRIFSSRGRQLRELSQHPCKRYRRVKANGRGEYVHRLVNMAFNGLPPAGHETCHRDGDPLNNQPSNLCWDTHRQNHADAVKHGVQHRFSHQERLRSRKLTEVDVAEIKRLLTNGEQSQRRIAARFGVDPATVTYIKQGRTWQHVHVAFAMKAAA